MPEETRYRDRVELLKGTPDLLERQGRVSSDWKVSDNNQRVEVCRLTAEGEKQLASERPAGSSFQRPSPGPQIRREGVGERETTGKAT
jgi:DNA-binding PadR family transcriptional regulator